MGADVLLYAQGHKEARGPLRVIYVAVVTEVLFEGPGLADLVEYLS